MHWLETLVGIVLEGPFASTGGARSIQGTCGSTRQQTCSPISVGTTTRSSPTRSWKRNSGIERSNHMRVDETVRRYLHKGKPKLPLPWHNHDLRTLNQGRRPKDPSRPHLTTERYARIMLDALAGDDRRAELRRVYRFYKCHTRPLDVWQTDCHWALIECVREYSKVLPPHLFLDYPKGIKTLRSH